MHTMLLLRFLALVMIHIVRASPIQLLVPRQPWTDWLAAATTVLDHNYQLEWRGAAAFAVGNDAQLQHAAWIADNRRRLPRGRDVVIRLLRTPRVYVFLASCLVLSRICSAIAPFLPPNLPAELPLECRTASASAEFCAAHLPCPASVLYISPLAETLAVYWAHDSPFFPPQGSNAAIDPLASRATATASIFASAIHDLVVPNLRLRIQSADYILAHNLSQNFVYGVDVFHEHYHYIPPEYPGLYSWPGDHRFFFDDRDIDFARAMNEEVVAIERAELEAGTFFDNIHQRKWRRDYEWDWTDLTYPLLPSVLRYRVENWTSITRYNIRASTDTSLWNISHFTTLYSLAVSTNEAVAVAISAEFLRLERALAAAGCGHPGAPRTCRQLSAQLRAVEQRKRDERLRALALYVSWEQFRSLVFALQMLQNYTLARMPTVVDRSDRSEALLDQSEALRLAMARTLKKHLSAVVKRAGVLAGLHWAHTLSREDGVDPALLVPNPAPDANVNGTPRAPPANFTDIEATCGSCWSPNVLRRKWIDCKALAARTGHRRGVWRWLLGEVRQSRHDGDGDDCDGIFDQGLGLNLLFAPQPTSFTVEEREQMDWPDPGRDLRLAIPGRSIWKYDIEAEDARIEWWASVAGMFDFDEWRETRIRIDFHLRDDWRWWKRNLRGKQCVDVGEIVLGEIMDALAADRVEKQRVENETESGETKGWKWWRRVGGRQVEVEEEEGDGEEEDYNDDDERRERAVVWCLGWGVAGESTRRDGNGCGDVG